MTPKIAPKMAPKPNFELVFSTFALLLHVEFRAIFGGISNTILVQFFAIQWASLGISSITSRKIHIEVIWFCRTAE